VLATRETIRSAELTLTGQGVCLRPLSEEHASALFAVGDEDEIWQYLPYGRIATAEAMRRWIRMLLERRDRGTDLPFAIQCLGDGRFAGATRYLRIDRQNRSVEIGGTWLGRDYRGTGVNAACKLLLLENAFENWGCIRVQLRSDVRNLRSHRALAKLGAVREGILRQDMLLPNGARRDSVVFSILDWEWPSVKRGLLLGLGRLGLLPTGGSRQAP
jgi:RimJ/RimL family protein N-acetyltransferase